jgi:ubiquinone/menaquinone biosynthesis C-methylase UbiE
MEAQSLSVKRAEVEFHNFASLGEPERAISVYAEENVRRAAFLRRHAAFIGPLSPFLEIGSNAGHTSYMLCNEFGAQGFALDLSADSLRYGTALLERWNWSKSPVRVAGDAANLPFRDGSVRVVLAYQMLSQFMDIERVFLEVKRVLAPGGIFLFAEEPLRRALSLRLYRCPYWESMKPWERKLYQWGLLGYLVTDVIGARQEESFGIRQNHKMGLHDWHALILKHFVAHEYEIFVPERGWGERIVKRIATRLDPYRSTWRAARLLGGTLAAACRKEGTAVFPPEVGERFEKFLLCPDCRGELTRDEHDTLRCACGYEAPNEGGVFNLLPSRERKELYPGDRADVVDFCLPNHEKKLLEGWYELEGVFGNKYRWMGKYAAVHLVRLSSQPQRLRVRGYVHPRSLEAARHVRVLILANGLKLGEWFLDRPGLFVIETDLPDSHEYKVEFHVSPTWQMPPDTRTFSINMSMIRLVPRETAVG